jgi:hypothetical protein
VLRAHCGRFKPRLFPLQNAAWILDNLADLATSAEAADLRERKTPTLREVGLCLTGEWNHAGKYAGQRRQLQFECKVGKRPKNLRPGPPSSEASFRGSPGDCARSLA